MIFVNRFWLSFPFQREILSAKLNCRDLFIHFNNCISGIQRTVRTINSFFDIENHRPQFSLQECASLLQRFSDLRDVNNGKSLHSILIKSGLHRDVFVQNNILRFYAACEELMNARLLFDEMPEPNLISWTSMISAYVQYGYNDLGLQLFSLMCRSGLWPNEFGYSVALKACGVTGNLLMGKVLHGQTLKSGFELCFFCNSSIFNMYVKSWEVDDARKLFNEIPLNERSEALWNTLLDSCVQVSKAKEAINFFHQMLHFNVSPTCYTYAILIKSCTDLWNFHLVKSFHGRTVMVGLDNHSFVGGALVDTYSKLGFLEDAYKVFQELEEKDNVVWSSLLAGFHQSGVAEQGLQLFGQFVSEGHKLDPFIFANAFSLCSSIEVTAVGSQVHCSFIKSGFALDSFIGSSLINMYVGTGMVCHAYKCFLEVRHKNEICFNAMIAGLTFHSEDGKALELFCKMRELGLIPGHSTISYVLRACANLHKLEEGRALHSLIVKTLVDSDSNFGTGNALIELYAKRGVVEEAIMVFKEMDVPNEFCWTTIISSYTESERLAQDSQH
uniref:Uncharacterized protein n=1 Tax=Nelumbo nucifera TaxID=4432 RepID=A0A822YI43_NELNU|nr:TPA_asm: hypothetical protein HUJ06_012715 [Nelumbo nucifera]